MGGLQQGTDELRLEVNGAWPRQNALNCRQVVRFQALQLRNSGLAYLEFILFARWGASTVTSFWGSLYAFVYGTAAPVAD